MFLMTKLYLSYLCANSDGCIMLYFSAVVSTFSKESFCQSYNGILQVQHNKMWFFKDNLLSNSIANNMEEGVKSSSLTLHLQR